MDWFVIQAYSGYEVKVKAALEEKIELEGLGDKFGEIIISKKITKKVVQKRQQKENSSPDMYLFKWN
jgi:transcriptional antiterminator NusG